MGEYIAISRWQEQKEPILGGKKKKNTISKKNCKHTTMLDNTIWGRQW